MKRRVGGWESLPNQGHRRCWNEFEGWRASSDDQEETKFFVIENAILKTACGNKCLDRSQSHQEKSGFQKSRTLAPTRNRTVSVPLATEEKLKTTMMRFVESRGKAIMDYEFVYEDDFLVIKLSGSTEVNERLSVKQRLAPYLQGSYQKVIVDLEGLKETEGAYLLGVLNTVKKEVQLMGGEVKFCSLKRELYRYFQENRLDQVFDIVPSVEQAKKSDRSKTNES